MAQKRDTNKYECYQGNKLVYVGITNDMKRREAEHRAEGMEFTSMRKSRKCHYSRCCIRLGNHQNSNLPKESR